MTAPTTYCNECGASNALQATHCFACNNALQPLAPSPLLQIQTASSNAAVLTSKVVGPLVPSYLLHARYSIVNQVGTGGFGAVYQAKDTLFSNRLVAIKEMSQDGLSSQELAEATAAFEREALLLADLTHPNLPRIHDHFTEHGRSYVVMDFIAGDTLEDHLDKFVWRLSLEATLDIGLQLCTVLDYLHTHHPPIIFRDLKPANIMRTVDNHVYLIDFGIARHFRPGKQRHHRIRLWKAGRSRHTVNSSAHSIAWGRSFASYRQGRHMYALVCMLLFQACASSPGTLSTPSLRRSRSCFGGWYTRTYAKGPTRWVWSSRNCNTLRRNTFPLRNTASLAAHC